MLLLRIFFPLKNSELGWYWEIRFPIFRFPIIRFSNNSKGWIIDGNVHLLLFKKKLLSFIYLATWVLAVA